MNLTKYGTAEAYDRFLPYDDPPKTVVINGLSGGMGDTFSLLLNMASSDESVRSVSAPKDAVFDGGFDEGAVTDAKYADGVFLFRKGHTLYALKDGVFSVVGEKGMLSEEQGVIYDYQQRFHVIDGEVIFAVDRALNIEVIEQNIPVCFKDVSRNGAVYTEIAPMNPFCRYIDIMLSDEASNEQKFPLSFAVDNTYARAWHADGKEVYPGYVMVREDRVIFDGDNAAGCRLRLRLLDAKDPSVYSFSQTADYRALLSRSTSAVVTLAENKTMLLIANGTEIAGVLLTDGFAFHSADAVFRYDCLQTVTDVVAFDDGYLLFFEDAVKKLTVREDENSISFSVLPFKNDFGSDMSGSIVCVDDKIVFASAKGGVCCIDRYGISERAECKKISFNIEDGEYGFFSHAAKEYETASAFAAFGQYYLTVGDVTYVWDYRAKFPTDAQTRADEREMVWHLNDALLSQKYLAFLDGKLYYTEKDTGKIRYVERKGGKVSCKMKTRDLDFGILGTKTLIECGVRYRAESAVRLSISCDENPYIDAYTFPASKMHSVRTVRTYGKRFGTLSLLLECEGETEIDAMIFRFL